jgi:hypothetical protein
MNAGRFDVAQLHSICPVARTSTRKARRRLVRVSKTCCNDAAENELRFAAGLHFTQLGGKPGEQPWVL